jgi:uncharacterized protein involved in exopolysaccharide biosynthesis
MTNGIATAAHAPITNPLRELLQPVADYKWYIVVFCASTILTSLALTYIYSEKYAAATTLLFRPQNVSEIGQKEMLAFGAPLPTPPFDLIYDNLQILVQSEPVLFPVIRELGLNIEEPVEYSGPWYSRIYLRIKESVKKFRDDVWSILKHGRVIKDNPDSAALTGLRENLKLINNNSFVFYLSFMDKYPERAARVVDAVAERVVEEMVKREQDLGNQRYQQQLDLRTAKEHQIDRIQKEIQALLQSNHTASVKLETEHSEQELFEFIIQRTKLDGKLSQAQARLKATEQHLAKNSQARSEAIEQHRVSQGSPSRVLAADDYQRLESDHVATEIEIDALNGELKTINNAIAIVNDRLARMPAVQRHYDQLIQDLETAQRDLVAIADPQLEAKVQANNATSEIVIAHKARVPSVPVTPIKVAHVSLASGLALCISFGMAYIAAFARSDQFSAMVTRTVTDITAMWDGVERRERNSDRRIANQQFDGPDRRKQANRRSNRDV